MGLYLDAKLYPALLENSRMELLVAYPRWSHSDLDVCHRPLPESPNPHHSVKVSLWKS